MAKVTIGYAILLILVGVGGYVVGQSQGSTSWTALIPAIIGALALVCGLVALKENLRKHAMHGAAMVSLLAILGTARGTMKLPRLLTGGDVERPLAVGSMSITFVLSAVFLGLCVKSFIDARKRRKAGE